MDKTILLVVLLLSNAITFSQEKEWKNLINLLNNEAVYFQGKSGFIQLLQSDYNIFQIEKMSVSSEKIVLGVWMKDRFENSGSEHYLEETLVFNFISGTTITSYVIDYNYRFYFESFPETQFLRIEFDTDHFFHQILSIQKDLKTGKQIKTTKEKTTDQLIIPIRKRNRKKILRAIDAFQLQTIKKQLDNDRMH